MMDRKTRQRLRELKAEMTPRRYDFAANQYLVDLNATQAAIRSGYAVGSASVEGSRLLADDKVAEVVLLLKRARAAKMEVTADRVIQEIASMAFADPGQMSWFRDEEGNNVRPMQEVDPKDKLKALELLGKHTAAFTENLNLTTNGKDLPANQTTVNVVINHRRRSQQIAAEEE